MKNFILYQGPSMLDGKPIVCVATMKSNNEKTGNMVQTWIIRADMHPVEARKTLEDASVCGSCPLRQGLGGACYVNLAFAPTQVYKGFQRGIYDTPSLEDVSEGLRGKAIRLGAYGDPAAVPFEVWENALKHARKWTGYTHQAKHKNFDPRILDYCMVSAETPKQAAEYHAKGLRTFRVIASDAPQFDNEIACPADTGVSCVECGKCSGATASGVSITIEVHGTRAKKHNTQYKNVNMALA